MWSKNSSLSAGALTTWTDSSGNSKSITAAGSPVVAADAQYGGLLSVPMNGTTNTLTSASLTFGPFTIFVVAKASSGDGYLVHRNNAGGGVDYVYKTSGNALNVSRSSVISGYNITANWLIGTVPRTIVHSFDGTHAGHIARINGTGQTLSSTSAGAPGTGTVANAIDMFGGLVGTVGEILVYDSALSVGNIALVETYLKNKFGHY